MASVNLNPRVASAFSRYCPPREALGRQRATHIASTMAAAVPVTVKEALQVREASREARMRRECSVSIWIALLWVDRDDLGGGARDDGWMTMAVGDDGGCHVVSY